jgi:hypothetical protein
MDIVAFCKNLKPQDWNVQVTKNWTVKDIVSHLVGWEKEVARELPRVWESGQQPWFMSTENYEGFNGETYEYYKDYSPEELISEFQKWENYLDVSIKNIGEENLRKHPHMDWVFDEGDEPHFEHHIDQIRKALDLK